MPRRRRLAKTLLMAAAASCWSTSRLAQSRYAAEVLAAKKRFSADELAALAEPFVDVRTGTGTVAGLFPISVTRANQGKQQSSGFWRRRIGTTLSSSTLACPAQR